jgi:branched-chain amino acid transport system permease protein
MSAELTSFLFRVFNGLTFGGLLFLIAIGFTLIFGLMRIVNMAHGAFYLLGAYVGWTFQDRGASWVVAIAAGTIVVGVTALLAYYLVRRVQGDLPQTLLTLGIGIVVADLALWYWTGVPRTIDPPDLIRQPVTVAGFTYPGFRTFILVTAIVVGLGLFLLLRYTQLGRIIRAGVDNRQMVSALGINIDRIFTLVFVLGGILIGFSGAIGGSFLSFGPGKDFEILTFALVVVIIGGLGSVAGSAVGAIIVGLVDSFGRSYFSELAIFLLSGTLLVVLAFRPQGLFGRKEQ